MAKLQQEIADTFLEKLKESPLLPQNPVGFFLTLP